MIFAQPSWRFGRGRPVTTMPAATVAFVGDSNSSLSYGSLHPWTWTIGLNGGVLKPIANSSVAGNTIADALARIDNLYTDASPGLAGLPEPLGWVFNRLGTNDTRGGAVISAQNKADFEALAEAELSYAERAVFFAVSPISSPESGAGVNSFNAWLAEFCATTSRLLFIDDCVTVNDGTGAWASGYAGGDGVHIPNQSSYRMGIDGGADPALVAALAGYASPISTDPLDVYPAKPQWVVNPLMSGTGGSASSPLTGQVASDWNVGLGGAGYAGTVAKVAADVGDPNQTPWQRLTPTQITDNGVDGGFGINAVMANSTITTLYPDAVDIVIEIRFNAFDTSKFRYLRAGLNGNNNEELSPPAYMRMGAAGTTSGICVLRSALRRSGTRQSHSFASGGLGLCPSTSFTGAMGSIDIRCMTIRG